MTWVAVAVAGSAVVGAAASNQAAKSQAGAAGQATALSRDQLTQARADLQPYRELGGAATTRIGQLLGFNDPQYDPRYKGIFDKLVADRDALHQKQYGFSIFDSGRGGGWSNGIPDFEKNNLDNQVRQQLTALGPAQTGTSVADVMAMDPGYQFRLSEGERALNNRLGSMGLRNSGAALKAGQRYAQDYASGEYGNIYNRLANAAGMGQGAVNTGVATGQNTVANVGNYLTGAANARGAAAINGANAWSNAFNTIGNYYGQQNTLDKILASRNGGGYNYNLNAPS